MTVTIDEEALQQLEFLDKLEELKWQKLETSPHPTFNPSKEFPHAINPQRHNPDSKGAIATKYFPDSTLKAFA